jgi:hypothetical protein
VVHKHGDIITFSHYKRNREAPREGFFKIEPKFRNILQNVLNALIHDVTDIPNIVFSFKKSQYRMMNVRFEVSTAVTMMIIISQKMIIILE